MTDTVRDAIEAGDSAALAELVAERKERATDPVTWGPDDKNVVPPLHFVCDAKFRRLVTDGQALALAEVLLAAGVDANLAYARSGDTFLIAAASLGAEKVGLRLLEAGAAVEPRGLFGATALHWAANMGLPILAEALVAGGAGVEVRDTKYHCTPIEWGIHAWREGTQGDRRRLPDVARLLLRHGARFPDDATALEGGMGAVFREHGGRL